MCSHQPRRTIFPASNGLQCAQQASHHLFNFSHCQHTFFCPFSFSVGSYISISIGNTESHIQSIFGRLLLLGRVLCLFQFSVIVDCIPFSFYKFSVVVAGNSTIDPKRTNIKSCSRLRIGKICTRDQTRFKQSYSPRQSQTATKAKQPKKKNENEIRTKYIKISVSRFVNATLPHPICYSYVFFFLFVFDGKVLCRSFVRTLSIFEFIIIATVCVVLDAGTNVTQPFDKMEM